MADNHRHTALRSSPLLRCSASLPHFNYPSVLGDHLMHCPLALNQLHRKLSARNHLRQGFCFRAPCLSRVQLEVAESKCSLAAIALVRDLNLAGRPRQGGTLTVGRHHLTQGFCFRIPCLSRVQPDVPEIKCSMAAIAVRDLNLAGPTALLD